MNKIREWLRDWNPKAKPDETPMEYTWRMVFVTMWSVLLTGILVCGLIGWALS